MNEDIDRLEPGLREVVASLKAAPEARVRSGFRDDVMAAIRAERVASRGVRFRRFVPSARFAAAAAIALLFGAGVMLLTSEMRQERLRDASAIDLAVDSCSSAVAPYARAYAVRALADDPSVSSENLSRAVAALAGSQNADGGWGSPALTSCNVAALAAAVRAGDKNAPCVWKRGVRYLRAHGISETDPFVAEESGLYFRRLRRLQSRGS